MDKVQANQLDFLKSNDPSKYILACNDCDIRHEPDNFGDCLAFYEAHKGHETAIIVR